MAILIILSGKRDGCMNSRWTGRLILSNENEGTFGRSSPMRFLPLKFGLIPPSVIWLCRVNALLLSLPPSQDNCSKKTSFRRQPRMLTQRLAKVVALHQQWPNSKHPSECIIANICPFQKSFAKQFWGETFKSSWQAELAILHWGKKCNARGSRKFGSCQFENTWMEN